MNSDAQTGRVGLPIAPPVGSSRWPESPLVGVPFFATAWQEALLVRSVSEDGSKQGTETRQHKISTNPLLPSSQIVSRLSGAPVPKRLVSSARMHSGEVELVELEMSERDRAILSSFEIVPLLSGEQIERLHCGGLSRDSRDRRRRDILNRLVRLRLLDKLPRRVGGVRSGSAGAVFGLGLVGERLVSNGRRSRWRGGIALVAHTLAVSEVFVRVKEAELAGDIANVSFVNEPQCWQTIEGSDLLSDSWLLKPDALLSYKVGTELEHWFIEVDRGTESPSTLKKKIAAYETAWEAGLNIHGVMPRVWWIEL